MKNDDDFILDMGKRIKQARDAAGLTQDQLAEKLGVGTRFISDIECARSGVSVKNLRRICQLCNVSSDQILFGLSDNNEIPFLVRRACQLPERQLNMYVNYTSMFFDLLSEDLLDLSFNFFTLLQT